jgi:hypothetical protein
MTETPKTATRTEHRTRFVAMVLGLLTAAVLSTAPAMAATTTFTDPRGDAPARFDLTRVTAVNEPGRIAVQVRVRNLRGGSPQIFGFGWRPVRSDIYYFATTVRRRDGSVRAVLRRAEETALVRVPCDVRARWALGRDTIRISFPQQCLELHRRAQVDAYIGAGNGQGGDPADWTTRRAVAYG